MTGDTPSAVLHLASTSSPVELAWSAFDAAAIRLNRMYAECAPDWDTPEERAARLSLSLEVVRLWDEFRVLLVGDDSNPKPAA